MADLAIVVQHDGQTVDVHRTCGYPNCLVGALIKLGVPERIACGMDLNRPGEDEVLEYVFPDEGDGRVVIELVDPGSSDEDTYCVWCGDFLSHGLECGCADTDTDLAPLATGELNP